MRLFLSSYRFGNHADALIDLVGEDAEVTVITNAKDYKTPAERLESVQDFFKSFKDIGITPHELDLRDYFEDNTGLQEKLKEHDFVWVTGGNTFVLRRALKFSGGDKLLAKLVLKDEIVYGAESAGSIVATPTLKGVEFGYDPYIVPAGYADEEVLDGLYFVPYSIVPHYESGWEGQDRMIEVLEEENIAYKTLNDFQVLVVKGDDEEILS